MMSRPTLSLYEPLYSLKEVDQNIWIVDGNLIQMDMKVFKLPFQTRMTVIKLNDGKLWIHSPIAPNEELFTELDALGKVAYLISPNKIHYAYIADWKQRYPHAQALSSPGVEERAKSQKVRVVFDAPLTDKAPDLWSDEIDQLIFKGSSVIEEVVFFHKSTKTLIVTDLIENFEPEKIASPIRRKFYRLARVTAPDGQTPIDYRMTFLGKQREAKSSFSRILNWKPDKIILAHGLCFFENGTDELKRAFRWIR